MTILTSSGSMDINHRLPDASSPPSSIDGCYTNPPWVLGELRRRAALDAAMALPGAEEQSRSPKLALDSKKGRTATDDARADVAMVELLKTCARKRDIHAGILLHAEITRRGLLEKNPFIGCSLISMLAKCGDLEKAAAVHAELPVRDVVSWNALLAAYVQHGKGHEALHSFEGMQTEGLSPNGVTFICTLKACGIVGDVDKGIQIHDEIAGRGLLERNVMLGNALVDVYTRYGMLEKAKQVLLDLPARNVVSWSTLIAGYARNGQGREAISCFEQMQREGISPNDATILSTLKACGSIGAINQGQRIHKDIIERGLLAKNVMLGNALVDMYAKCGMLTKARQVLDELPARNVVCWSALIAGYTQEGQCHEAVNCFLSMLQEGICPNEVTFVCVLKACGSTGAIRMGQQIHDQIIIEGILKKNIILGNALVDMYAKCGILDKAAQTLDVLPVRNTISWSSLITGLAEHGRGYEALNCFERMKMEGLSPDGVTYACVLKACGTIGAINKGREIHDEILDRGLLKGSVKLGTALIDMYAKCDMLAKAREVLEELPVQDAVSWSVIIYGYAHQGQYHEALGCFERMQKDGLYLDEVTFLCVLQACGNVGAVYKGKQIHSEIINRGFLKENTMLGNALVDMYVKFGMLARAREVLEELPVQNIVTWNTLIAGYVQNEQSHEAMECWASIKRKGIAPDEITFSCMLKACGILGDVIRGEEVHSEISNHGCLKENVVIGTSLIDMYGKCGLLSKARQVLEELCGRDVVSWSALIAGYAQAGQGLEALNCLVQMQKESLYPNEVTFLCILKACASIGAIDVGRQIHKEIVNRGFLKKNVELGNALVDMYAKCGMLANAKQLLEKLPIRNVATWNALIGGYAENEQCHKALDCLEKMKGEDLCPDEVTFACTLKACGRIGDVEMVEKLRNEILDRGLLDKNITLGNSLLGTYAKCGMTAKAREVLENLPIRNVVSWNALIATYVRNGEGHEAFISFECMQSEGISPDEATFVSILKACTTTGAIEKGKQFHNDILRTGLLGKSISIGGALVSMYAKCGLLAKAEQVLDMLANRDAICWSALIAGYAQKRLGVETLDCFARMQREGHSPDAVTFLCVLNACCHAGKLGEAQTYYENMSGKYGILPSSQHAACMMILYGHAGQFDEAMSVAKTMAAADDASLWFALLGTCCKWGNLKLGELVFEQATQHDKSIGSGIYSYG